MAKTFAEFIAQTQGLMDLRATIERLAQEHTRRQMISKALEVVGQEFQRSLNVQDIYRPQLLQLFQLYPILLRSAQTPSEVAQLTAGVQSQLAQIEQRRAQIQSTLQLTEQMSKQLGEIQKQITEYSKTAPETVKPVVEGYMSAISNLINFYSNVARQLALSGQVEQAQELMTKTAPLTTQMFELPSRIALRRFETEERVEEAKRIQELQLKVLPEILKIEGAAKLKLYKEQREIDKDIELAVQKGLVDIEIEKAQKMMPIQIELKRRLSEIDFETQTKLMEQEYRFRKELMDLDKKWEYKIGVTLQKLRNAGMIEVAKYRVKMQEILLNKQIQASMMRSADILANQIAMHQSAIETYATEIANAVTNPDNVLLETLKGGKLARGGANVRYDKTKGTLILETPDGKTIKSYTPKPERKNEFESLFKKYQTAVIQFKKYATAKMTLQEWAITPELSSPVEEGLEIDFE